MSENDTLNDPEHLTHNTVYLFIQLSTQKPPKDIILESHSKILKNTTGTFEQGCQPPANKLFV